VLAAAGRVEEGASGIRISAAYAACLQALMSGRPGAGAKLSEYV
jgi:hypothetical protein